MKTQLLVLLTGAAILSTVVQASDVQTPSTNAQSQIDPAASFDSDVGFDATWAAEKKLLKLFKAEGFISQGTRSKDGVENTNYKRASDGAEIHYAYVRSMYPQPATYRLSASRNSPSLPALLSIAAKISPQRLTLLKEALRQFDATKEPVVRTSAEFKKRGDFRVRLDENGVELENLWKGKGL